MSWNSEEAYRSMEIHHEAIVGESSTIVLREMGSAGYLWDPSTMDRDVALVTEDFRIPTASIDSDDGIGGTVERTFVVEGVSPGIVSFHHRRPWSGEAIDTCIIECRAR